MNTWQMTLPLHGNTSDPADINAKNYQYGVVGIGDFNGDGRSDLLLQNTMPDNVSGVGITGAGDIFTFLTGDEAAVKGGTGPTVCYAGKADPANIKGWSIAGVGDFNNDSIDDVLLQNKSTGDIACWIMSDGQMQQSSWIGTTDLTIEGIWDVDADGTDDIILSDGISFTVWTVKNGALGGAQLLA